MKNLMKALLLTLAISGCTNNAALPPIQNTNTNPSPSEEKNDTQVKAETLVEQIKNKKISDDQAFNQVSKLFQEFVEQPVANQEDTAHSIAEAVSLIQSGKQVHNLATLLAIEISQDPTANLLEQVEELLMILQSIQGDSQESEAIQKDRIIIELISILISREADQSAQNLVSSGIREYFAARIQAMQGTQASNLFYGYSGLIHVVNSNKWLSQQFFKAFSSNSIQSYSSYRLNSLFYKLMSYENDFQSTKKINSTILQNLIYTSQFQLRRLKTSANDLDKSTQVMTELIQTLGLLEKIYANSKNNFDFIEISQFVELLDQRYQLFRTVRDQLAQTQNQEVLKNLRLIPETPLTLAYLQRAFFIQRIEQKDYQQNLEKWTHQYLKDSVDSESQIESVQKYYTKVDLMKAYLEQISSLPSDPQALTKGRVVQKDEKSEIELSHSEKVKREILRLIQKAEPIVYIKNTSLPTVKNCYANQTVSDVCTEFRGSNLNQIEVVGEEISSEVKKEADYVSIKGGGVLKFPAGIFTANDGSLVEIDFDQIDFHPLSVLQVYSGNVQLSAGKIESLWVDVSGRDRETQVTASDKGSAPEIKNKSVCQPRSHISGYYYLYYRHSAKKCSKWDIVSHLTFRKICVAWEDDSYDNSKWEHFSLTSPDSFKNIPVCETSGIQTPNPMSDINTIMYPGRMPVSPEKQNRGGDGGTITLIQKTESQQKSLSSNLLFTQGGNGAKGIEGHSSPLCENNVYKPFKVGISAYRDQFDIWKNYFQDTLIIQGQFREGVYKGKNFITHKYGLLQIEMPRTQGGDGGDAGAGGKIIIQASSETLKNWNPSNKSFFVSQGLIGTGGSPGACGPNAVVNGVDGLESTDGSVMIEGVQ